MTRLKALVKSHLVLLDSVLKNLQIKLQLLVLGSLIGEPGVDERKLLLLRANQLVYDEFHLLAHRFLCTQTHLQTRKLDTLVLDGRGAWRPAVLTLNNLLERGTLGRLLKICLLRAVIWLRASKLGTRLALHGRIGQPLPYLLLEVIQRRELLVGLIDELNVLVHID